MNGGTQADPALLEGLASRLRNASAELESGISPPPEVEAGVVTGAIQAALAQLTDALGQVVTGVGGLGDCVADSGKTYVGTDQDQAAEFGAIDPPR